MTRIWSFDRSVTSGLVAMALIAVAVSSFAVFATWALLPEASHPEVDSGVHVREAESLQLAARNLSYASSQFVIERSTANLEVMHHSRVVLLERLRRLRENAASDRDRTALARIVKLEYQQEVALDKRLLTPTGIVDGHDYRADLLAARLAFESEVGRYAASQTSSVANSIASVRRRMYTAQRWVLVIASLALMIFLLMVIGLRRSLLGLYRAETQQRRSANRAREAAERWANSQAETEETTRLIIERAIDGVVTTDQRGIVTGWNQEAERIFGWTAGQFVGRPFTDLVLSRRDQVMTAAALEECARFGGSQMFDRRLELHCVNSAGDPVTLEAVFTSLRRGTVYFVVFLHDVSERNRIEARIRASEEEFRATFESSGIGHVRLAFPSGTCLRINPMMQEICGYTAEELRGEPFLGRLHPAEPEADVLGLRALITQGEGMRAVEARLTRKDGAEVWVHVTGTVIPPSDRQPASILAAVQDLSQLRLAQSALRTTEERFRIMADTAPVLVWMSGPDGGQQWVNRPWLQFTGRELDQELGSGWTDNVHPDDRPAVLSVYERALSTRQRFSAEFRMRRADSEWRWVLDNGVPLRDGTGEFSGYIGSCIDITERKRAEEQREGLLGSERRARAEAERANRIKDEFLATLSHELRTPLQAMLGWCRLLAMPGLDPEEAKHGLEVIDRNVTLQMTLIGQLLDMSRIVQGKMQLEMREVRLASTIDAALDVVRPSAEAKSIRIVTRIPHDLAPIYGDPQRLQQVIWNLLSNAIKFTPAGGSIEIILQHHGSALDITVRDTGQGIRPEFLPMVFGRFLQQDASTTRRHGGLGLGLAIVRNLVELHGGRVWAESEGEGRGSTFTVQLPGRIPPAAGEPEWETTAAWLESRHLARSEAFRGLRVLVVDDEPDTLDLLQRILGEQGASVRGARSAQEAIEAQRSFQPNVLISDIGMPGQDGYHLMHRLRDENHSDDRPLLAIALTAFAGEEDRERATRAGFDLHLAKPIEPSELLSRMVALMDSGARTTPQASGEHEAN